MSPLPVTLFALTVLCAGCHEELGVVVAPNIERVAVSELDLDGVSAVEESALRAVLETRESSWLPWGEKHYLRREVFQADLERIKAFYEDRGYPNATITDTNVDVAADGHSVSLRIAIEEGEPVLVDSVQFEGFEPLSAEAMDSLRARIPLDVGEPFARPDALESVQTAAGELKEAGFAYARVDLRERNEAPGRVRVTLRAEPGTRAFFGPIEIAGNASVDDSVIRRQLMYRPGELFTTTALQESQRRLYGLGLFQFANIEVLDAESQPLEVKTRVTVAERDHRHVELAMGYGTEEKLRGEVEWRHVNFFGGARTATVHGKWSWLDRGIEGTFLQPYLFRPEVSFQLRGHAWYADEPAYRILSRGGRGTLAWTASQRHAASLTYVHEFESSRIANEALLDPDLRDDLIALGLDPTTGEQDGVLSALVFSVRRDTTVNPLDRTRGHVVSLQVEQGGGWLPGSWNYTNVLGDGRVYHTTGGMTFAQRLRVASIAPLGPVSDVPFFKRYFLGGSDSLRGWGRFEVSPLSGAGLPIGGHSLLEFTSEVRFPLVQDLGAVLFVDGGNVWTQAWDFDARDLLYDAGAGVRYRTPVGPLRFDIAYQLTPTERLRVDGERRSRRWRMHFSIGQAF